MIPPALRTLAGGHSDDTLVVCPGITYRRDAIDRQHLGVLREAELVVERRDGTRRLYRASPAQMDRLRQYLDEYWTASLQRLQFLAESAEREKGNTGG
jgi:phenylalanyl-tRNA synthetase alpha subunit